MYVLRSFPQSKLTAKISTKVYAQLEHQEATHQVRDMARPQVCEVPYSTDTKQEAAQAIQVRGQEQETDRNNGHEGGREG